MADQKISELTAKTTIHDNDLLVMVDSEANPIETKKITGANLREAVEIMKIFTKNITSAANAGDVTLATVTSQACFIKSIVVKANSTQTTDLIYIIVSGGSNKAITFIDQVSGIRANIADTDQQVSWDGSVQLDATDTIIITLTGSGSTAVNLQVTIQYMPAVSGGYLA